MKKLESLGKSLTKKEQKQISGGYGYSIWYCNGTNDGPDGHTCDYFVTMSNGYTHQFCFQGCHLECSTSGTTCYIMDSEA